MSGDEVDDGGGFGQPLPPDDRLWRHPSEMFAVGASGRHGLVSATPPADRSWVTVLLAGLVGALLATGVLVATGTPWDREVPRDVVERVALTPVLSAPAVPGNHQIAEVVERVSPSVALVEAGDGSPAGSAVAFRNDGHLLTSASLIGETRTVVVATDGVRQEAEVVGVDRYTEVAVLRVGPPHPPAAVLGEVGELRVGDPALVVAAEDVARTEPLVLSGIVSGLARRVDRVQGHPLHGMLQVNVPVEGEIAGGPLVDSRGAVVGITDPSPDQSGGGFGFAVPIDVARRVADDIIDTGSARHCWLGIEGTDLAPDHAERALMVGGAVVEGVIEASPAQFFGLAPGDVIVRLGRNPISSMDDLVTRLRSCRPGDQMGLRFVRDGKEMQMRVTVGRRPPHQR
jgi:S1-C subfamily serine protease